MWYLPAIMDINTYQYTNLLWPDPYARHLYVQLKARSLNSVY